MSAFEKTENWSEFTDKLSHLSDTDKGTAFEYVVAHYLRTDPVYRAKLAHVWLLNEVPADLYTRLRLPPRDMGIDLVAETHSGEFWAVQAKFRADGAASIPFAELATFSSLAFHVCAGSFSYALVCTTTARITGTLAGLPDLGEITSETWSTLTPDFFASFAASAGIGAIPPPIIPRQPRDHQAKAIDAAVSYYADPGQTRGKLIHPCGSGKSLTAYWIARRLDASRVLIAVPSLALVRQTLETWMREAIADARTVDWLCVCSDDEIASDFDNETLVAHVHELGIPCDTDPQKLAGHLRAVQTRPGLLVVLTTYQSSPVLAAAARDAGTAFDFAVFDEAHKTTGAASSYYAHLLHDEHLLLPRRLFMTATERRFASNRSDDIVSMDDPALYGETIDLLTFKAAIAADDPILCDYRLLTIGVRESEVRALVTDNRWLDLGPDGLDEVTSLALASLIALRRATTQYGVRHTVSFHSSILRASRFRDLNNRLNDHLATETPVAAYHVSGKMGSAARERELNAFLNATPSLVTNSRCLTEGVDVPGIDCVFFADPKGSTIDIVQASGRALRLAPGKQLGYILLPLVVPDGVTPDELIKSGNFRFILSVLRALAAQDDRIVEWFREAAQGHPQEINSLVSFDCGDLPSHEIDADDFANQIEITCWEKVAKLAYKSYPEAKAWARLLQLDGVKEWWLKKHELYAKGEWPFDIPADASTFYRDKGWEGWGEFLGTGNIAPSMRVFRPYEQARDWALTLNLRSSLEWLSYLAGKRPDLPSRPIDIPAHPYEVYKSTGWTTFSDYFGTDRFRPAYWPFEQAREWARAKNLKTAKEWYNLSDRPIELPITPDNVYADSGWLGWGDFLGTGRVANYLREFWPYEKAREFVHSLDIRTSAEWYIYRNGGRPDLPPRPDGVPYSPDQSYKGAGWINWEAFLPFRWRSYPEARKFAHALKLKGQQHWKAYASGKRPDLPPIPEDIPKAPSAAYVDHGWTSWGDWLGNGQIASTKRDYLPYAEARAVIHALELKTRLAWLDLVKTPNGLPIDIPKRPHEFYVENGWIDWSDWIGCPVKEPRPRVLKPSAPRYRDFASARAYVHTLGLGGSLNWQPYVRGEFADKPPKPADIPASPRNVYRTEWQGWGDWLGTGNIAPVSRQFRPFSEARDFARTLGLRTSEDWRKWYRKTRPEDLPSNPASTYAKDGFIDWPDFVQGPQA